MGKYCFAHRLAVQDRDVGGANYDDRDDDLIHGVLCCFTLVSLDQKFTSFDYISSLCFRLGIYLICFFDCLVNPKYRDLKRRHSLQLN